LFFVFSFVIVQALRSARAPVLRGRSLLFSPAGPSGLDFERPQNILAFELPFRFGPQDFESVENRAFGSKADNKLYAAYGLHGQENWFRALAGQI